MRYPVILALVSAVVSTGCHRDSGKLGDAPRTEKASTVVGWKDVSTSGVAFRLPSDWKTIEIDKGQFEESTKKTFGDDPKFADMAAQAKAAAKSGLVKLTSFDPSSVGSGFGTNCNVVIQDIPSGYTLEMITNASAQQLAPALSPGTQTKTEYIDLKSGRVALMKSQMKPQNPRIPELLSLGYLAVKDTKLAVITFTAPLSSQAKIEPVAKQSMEEFRFTN